MECESHYETIIAQLQRITGKPSAALHALEQSELHRLREEVLLNMGEESANRSITREVNIIKEMAQTTAEKWRERGCPHRADFVMGRAHRGTRQAVRALKSAIQDTHFARQKEWHDTCVAVEAVAGVRLVKVRYGEEGLTELIFKADIPGLSKNRVVLNKYSRNETVRSISRAYLSVKNIEGAHSGENATNIWPWIVEHVQPTSEQQRKIELEKAQFHAARKREREQREAQRIRAREIAKKEAERREHERLQRRRSLAIEFRITGIAKELGVSEEEVREVFSDEEILTM